MADKRLTFNVEEDLHARLKAEAAEMGVPLGSHCARLLENAVGQPRPLLYLDKVSLAAMPLDELRKLSTELTERQPEDWMQSVTRINSEIRRRYRV